MLQSHAQTTVKNGEWDLQADVNIFIPADHKTITLPEGKLARAYHDLDIIESDRVLVGCTYNPTTEQLSWQHGPSKTILRDFNFFWNRAAVETGDYIVKVRTKKVDRMSRGPLYAATDAMGGNDGVIVRQKTNVTLSELPKNVEAIVYIAPVWELSDDDGPGWNQWKYGVAVRPYECIINRGSNIPGVDYDNTVLEDKSFTPLPVQNLTVYKQPVLGDNDYVLSWDAASKSGLLGYLVKTYNQDTTTNAFTKLYRTDYIEAMKGTGHRVYIPLQVDQISYKERHNFVVHAVYFSPAMSSGRVYSPIREACYPTGGCGEGSTASTPSDFVGTPSSVSIDNVTVTSSSFSVTVSGTPPTSGSCSQFVAELYERKDGKFLPVQTKKGSVSSSFTFSGTTVNERHHVRLSCEVDGEKGKAAVEQFNANYGGSSSGSATASDTPKDLSCAFERDNGTEAVYKCTWDFDGAINLWYWRNGEAFSLKNVTANSAILSLAKGINYNVQVHNVLAVANGDQTKKASTWIDLRDSAKASLAAPSGFYVRNIEKTEVDVVWDSVTGASSYEIELKPSANGTSSFKTSNLSYPLKNLKPGTAYSTRIRSLTSNGAAGDWSSAKSFTTDEDVPPAMPSGLRIKSGTGYVAPNEVSETVISATLDFISNFPTEIHLEWNKVSDAEFYNLYYSGSVIERITSTEYVLKNLKPSSAYGISLVAFGDTGKASERTQWLAVQTKVEGQTGPVLTGVDADLKVTNITPTTAKLTWKAEPSKRTFPYPTGELELRNYRIYLNGNTWKNVSSSETTHILTGLSPDTEYEVEARPEYQERCTQCGSGWKGELVTPEDTGSITFSTVDGEVSKTYDLDFSSINTFYDLSNSGGPGCRAVLDNMYRLQTDQGDIMLHKDDMTLQTATINGEAQSYYDIDVVLPEFTTVLNLALDSTKVIDQNKNMVLYRFPLASNVDWESPIEYCSGVSVGSGLKCVTPLSKSVGTTRYYLATLEGGLDPGETFAEDMLLCDWPIQIDVTMPEQTDQESPELEVISFSSIPFENSNGDAFVEGYWPYSNGALELLIVDESAVSCSWKLDGEGLDSSSDCNVGEYTQNFTFEGLEPGEHTISLQVTDEHGHPSEEELTFTYHPFVPTAAFVGGEYEEETNSYEGFEIVCSSEDTECTEYAMLALPGSFSGTCSDYDAEGLSYVWTVLDDSSLPSLSSDLAGEGYTVTLCGRVKNTAGRTFYSAPQVLTFEILSSDDELREAFTAMNIQTTEESITWTFTLAIAEALTGFDLWVINEETGGRVQMLPELVEDTSYRVVLEATDLNLISGNTYALEVDLKTIANQRLMGVLPHSKAKYGFLFCSPMLEAIDVPLELIPEEQTTMDVMLEGEGLQILAEAMPIGQNLYFIDILTFGKDMETGQSVSQLPAGDYTVSLVLGDVAIPLDTTVIPYYCSADADLNGDLKGGGLMDFLLFSEAEKDGKYEELAEKFSVDKSLIKAKILQRLQQNPAFFFQY